MEVLDTTISDLKIVGPKIFSDARGYFFESFNSNQFKRFGLPTGWVQDNQSFSTYGVIRGLHYQLDPHAQSKLVRVLQGTVYDVAVDLRKSSPTFGQWFGMELSSENQLMLMIPKGFAHGFSVISRQALVLYKCDELYNPGSERGIIYNDPLLKINWHVPAADTKISERDSELPALQDAEMNFT